MPGSLFINHRFTCGKWRCRRLIINIRDYSISGFTSEPLMSASYSKGGIREKNGFRVEHEIDENVAWLMGKTCCNRRVFCRKLRNRICVRSCWSDVVRPSHSHRPKPNPWIRRRKENPKRTLPFDRWFNISHYHWGLLNFVFAIVVHRPTTVTF